MFPKLLLRGSHIAKVVEGRGLRSRLWVLQRGQEHGHLELELLDVFSHLHRVNVVRKTFNPRRGDQTHAFDLVLQLEVQWVRYWWRPGEVGPGPAVEGHVDHADLDWRVIVVREPMKYLHGCCKALVEPMRRS